jgi:hypothetical protein
MDMTRTASLSTGLKYCLLYNQEGQKDIDRGEAMKKKKPYSVR